MDLAESYLAVQKLRMGRRLNFAIDVPHDLREAPLPPMMLLTLVENAIKHGLSPLPEGGFVRISAEAVQGALRVRVADSGGGFVRTSGGGTGLANLRARLSALSGNPGRLELGRNEPRGITATITLPGAVEAGAKQSMSDGAHSMPRAIAASDRDRGTRPNPWPPRNVVVTAALLGLGLFVFYAIVRFDADDFTWAAAPKWLAAILRAQFTAFAMLLLAWTMERRAGDVHRIPVLAAILAGAAVAMLPVLAMHALVDRATPLGGSSTSRSRTSCWPARPSRRGSTGAAPRRRWRGCTPRNSHAWRLPSGRWRPACRRCRRASSRSSCSTRSRA